MFWIRNIGKNATNITSSRPTRIAAPKIVGAATIDKNTGIAECLGNCGVSIFKVSNGIVAQNDKLAMTINGSQPSIPV